MSPPADLVAVLLTRLREISGIDEADAAARFSDALDSMAFVEFLALVADDCGVPVEVIEQATGRRYGTVTELAAAMSAAGLRPVGLNPSAAETRVEPFRSILPQAWLTATTAGLPMRRQPASEINALLHCPPGWLEDHAGIVSRCVWDDEDALDVAARAGRAALEKAGLSNDASLVLLATSEATPVPIGLAAVLHQRLGLPSGTVALELGGACTGFLMALWTAQRFVVDTDAVLILAVEAPSRWLPLRPGAAGEAAALFGDGSAACVLTRHPTANALLLRDLLLGTDGSAGALLHVEREAGGFALRMDGVPLAQRAVRTMADAVRQMSRRHGLRPEQLAAVVAHGGNGRMPALLARRLGLPAERVWSETSRTGNLGSASLPIARASRGERIRGPAIWTAVGAGLQWGAALFEATDSVLVLKE